MGDSLRQQIVEAVGTRLATITTANGYRTNAGANVSTWRARSAAWDQDSLPALNVRDVDDIYEDAAVTGRLHRQLGFEVDIVVADSSEDAAETARHVIADIQEAIGTDESWGSLARLTRYRGDSLEPEHKEKRLVMAQARFDVMYQQARFNPDTAA